jgi:predicted nucleotidyltransferase
VRFVGGLDPVLGSPTKLRLLRALLPPPNKGWTGREMARGARVSTAQTARDLNDFLEVGIVVREVRGRSYSWRVNEQHVLLPVLSHLIATEAQLRTTLLRDVGDIIDPTPIRRALLFGSIARGDERSDSDVDLFAVVGSARDKKLAASALERVRERVWSRYGNPVSSLLYTESEARRRANPGLVEAIVREGIPVGPRKGVDRGKGRGSPKDPV